MVGRKEACRSETVVHLFEICSARQYVVARIKRVETETVANAELHPGARHELHQAHRTTRRDRVLVASAFKLDDGTNPARRHGEAIGGLLDEFGEPIDGFRTRRGCAHALDSKSVEAAIRHMNGATATIMRQWDEATEPMQSSAPTHRYDFSVAGWTSAFWFLDKAGRERSKAVRRNCNQSKEWECRA